MKEEDGEGPRARGRERFSFLVISLYRANKLNSLKIAKIATYSISKSLVAINAAI